MDIVPAGNAQFRRTPTWVWVLAGLAIGLAVLYILMMLVAIPGSGAMKKQANETAAIRSLHSIMLAEMQYDSTYPANGYACSLMALGGAPGSGPPSPAAAQLIEADLASGHRSGYIFAIGNCTRVTINGADLFTGFEVTAVPVNVGKSGDRGFCSDQSGGIKFDPAGGTNCTQPLQ
jgi:type IV pilus assembly protein PilA